MTRCPHCNKTIGYMPAKDVTGKRTRLPKCPYRRKKK